MNGKSTSGNANLKKSVKYDKIYKKNVAELAIQPSLNTVLVPPHARPNTESPAAPAAPTPNNPPDTPGGQDTAGASGGT